MPTPSPSWNSVRVHGTWVNQDGSLKAGSYKVSIPVRVTNDTDDVIIPAGTFATGTLNTTNGLPSFDLQIPATDDPDNSPPFQVRIEITFPDALGEMYQIDVPVALKDDANGLDLEKVVLTSTFTPVETLVKGIPGGVAELDSAGFVLDASGNRVTGGAAGALLAANNLSDVSSKATARGNLGLGTASTQPTSAFATPSDLTALSATFAARSANLSDLANTATARANLGARRRTVKVSDLPNPWILPHRGAGANMAPENSLDAFRVGSSYGTGIIDGGDWWTTSDGVLFCSHDATLDRTTNRTGNVSDMSAPVAAMTTVDASSWFGGVYSDGPVPTAEQVLSIYSGTSVMTPEAKSLAAANLLAPLISRLGLQDSVIVNAFDPTWLVPFQNVGVTNVALNISAMLTGPQMTAYTAQGINWIWCDYTTITAANVTTLANAGFKVGIFTPTRAAHISQYASVMGSISGWISDDPLYLSHAISAGNATRYRRTTDPFKTQTYYHGHAPNISFGTTTPSARYRGTFLGTKRWGFQTTLAGGAGGPWDLQGWACPLANPTTYTIALNLTFDALGSDTSRWGGMFIAQPTDDIFADTNAATETGYEIWFRVTGALNLVRKAAGVAGTTQTVATTAVTAPLTLSAGLTAGTAITALPVTAIPSALAAGVKLILPSGEIATVATGGAAAAATSVPINSVTPSAAVASGASIPQTIPLTVAVTATTVTATRVDTGQSVSVTDNTTRGAYWFLGMNDGSGASGLHVSYSDITIT